MRQVTHNITKCSGLKNITKSIGRSNRRSIALQVMQDQTIRKNILTVIVSDIQKELTLMCSKGVNSILRNSTSQAMASFTWESIVDELKTHAPTLLAILRGCVTVRRRVRVGFAKATPARRQRRWKRKSNRCPEIAVLGLCAAILLRHKNLNMNLVQRIVSVLLNCGHASKQVTSFVLSVLHIHAYEPSDVHKVTEDATVSLAQEDNIVHGHPRERL